MYTIFINDKPFIITEDQDYLIHDFSYQHFYNEDSATVQKLSREFVSNTKNRGLILHTSNSLKAFEIFCRDYEVLEAAGGIVENELNQLLVIFRKGKWDLPKGKIEAEETETIAAKREVIEECGVTNVVVKKKLTTSYHTYYMGNKNVLKISHWYMMFCPSTDKLKPQTEEDITEIKWVDKYSLDLNSLNTYGSILHVLKFYLNKKFLLNKNWKN